MESSQHTAATTIQKYIRSNVCITKYRLMKKMNFKRNGIAKELLKTEENYVRRLTVLEDVFQRPLTEQCNSATPLVTRQDVRTLFGDVEVILGLNRVVLQEITAKLQHWTSAALIGDVFVKLGKVGAFRWYHSYVSNYDKAFALLKHLKSSSKSFKEFIEQAETRPELNLSDLESLLILPIQRIPQYNMLLSDLLKNTWTEHPDYKNIKQAVKTMHEIATLVNEKKRESENIERVVEIEAKIDGFPQLAVPHRRFISDTVWQHVQTDGADVTAPRDIHLLLFNDIILLAAEINERFWVEQYSYFGRVFLNENPTGVPNKERSVNIKMKDKVFGLTARDEKEKNSWCVAFLSTVQLARKLENDQRKLTEHKRNLTIKLSNRPTREMLTMRGIITPEASPLTSPVAPERLPQTARATLQQNREGDEDYSTEQASEGSDDYSATTTESSLSVLQTDIFNIYLTAEQLQQRLTELFMPMLPSDLQVLLDARRSRARALYTMDVAVSKKKIVLHLLVITESRVLFLVKGKIVHEAHLLDIVTVRAKEDKALCIEFKNFKVEGVSEHTDDVINRLRRSFMANFPAMPEGAWFESDVEPINRLDPLPIDTYALSLPCGGFVNAYKSICNYLSIEPRGDIIWDMKNLYHVQRVKEFNFKMFELPETDDEYKAIMLALRYNPWFTHLIVRDNRLLSRDAANSIMNLFRHTSTLTHMDVANSSFTRESYATLHEALVFNQSYTQLRYLDLSNTSVEDKGLTFLTSFIERCGDSVNVEHLDLTNTNLSSRGLATLFNCFKKCAPLLDHLTYLNISDNRLDQEGSGVMSQWLALPNFKLRTIKLVNTQAHLPLVVPAVQRGCLRLTELDVSKNRFTDKVRPALVRLLQGNDSLKRIALNGTGMSAEALVELLSTVHSNSYLAAIAIEAAENNFGPAGAAAIAHQLRQMRGVTELNLRDNEFGDEGVGALCAALTSLDINPVTLHTLVLDGNFKFKNQKERSLLVKRLSALILASHLKLTKLSIAGGPRSSQQLRHELGPVLLSLAHNSRLEELNIKGHKLGNRGVFALARAIQTNATLKNIQWDDNALTSPSLERIIAALKVNSSVKDGAVPSTDIAQLVTTEPTAATHFNSLLTVLSDRVTLTPVNTMPPPKRRAPRSQKSSAVLAAPASMESDTQSTSSADRPASEQLPRRRAGSKSSKGSLEDVFSEVDDSSRRTLLQRQSRRAANLREFVQSPAPGEESKPESVARKSEDNAVEKKKEKRKSVRKTKQVTAKASELVKAATDRKGNLTARDKRDKKEKRLSGKREKHAKTSFETRQSDLERERLEAIKNMGLVDVNATPGVVPILSIATALNKSTTDDRTKSPRTKKTKTPRDKSPKEDKPVTPHENPAVVVSEPNKSREPTPRQLSPRTLRTEDVKVEPVKTDVSPRTPRTEDVKVEPVAMPTDTSPRNSREPTPREMTPREPSPRTPRTEDKAVPDTDVSPLRPPSRPLSVENSEDEADEPIGDLPVDDDDDDSEEEHVRVVERQNSLVMRELDDEARALVNPSVAEIEAAMKSNVSDIQDKLDELLLAQEGEKDVHPEHAEDQPHDEHTEDHAEHHEEHDDEHSVSEEERHEHGDTPHSHSHENSEDEDETDEHKKHEEHSSEHEEDNDEDESPREYDEDHEDDVLVL